MSYVNMDHASWVEGQLGYLAAARSRKKSNAGAPPTPTKLSPFQRTVMNILGIIGCGIYNAPIGKLDNIDWDFGGGVSVCWKTRLSTFDFSGLTDLVFLCHEARIRCEVQAVAPRRLRLSFWQRTATGDISRRHPNLDEAVATFREWFKAGHPIEYGEEDAPALEAQR